MVGDEHLATQGMASLTEQPVSQLTVDIGSEGVAYKRLTAAQIALILQLHDAQKTQTEIAEILGFTQATISRTLAKFTSTKQLATRRAEAAALPTVKALIHQVKPSLKDGDTKPAELILELAGLGRKQQADANVAVQVNVGLPGNANPIIDAEC